MKLIALILSTLLLCPTLAVAFDPPAGISCPLYIDQNAAPFGMCIACESPAGPITNCPVTELGNGSLGCACQNGNNVVRCTDPNIQRCGGILPFCSALDVCYLNTVTTCVNEVGSPAYAPDCYIGSPSMPLGCECWTVTLRRPLSQEEKTAYTKANQIMASFVSAALLVFVGAPSIPVSLISMWRSAATVLGESVILTLGLANDPARADYTTVTLPDDVVLAPYVTPSPSAPLRPSQIAALNAASALFTELQKAHTAALASLERAMGAQEAASITYYESQLDAYDVAAARLNVLYGQMGVMMPQFCGPVWDRQPVNGIYTKDYRPYYQAAGICDPVLAQGLLDLSAANLMSQR